MNRYLVTYFSASGLTGKVAKQLAEAVEADVYEIKPEIEYTSADLNWMDKKSRSTLEMQNPTARPGLADKNADIENHDVIFVGFPIWWYRAPMIINSFLESYDFTGKTIVLFATSGGSQFGKTLENLEDSVKGSAKIMEGKILNGSYTVEELSTWVKNLNL